MIVCESEILGVCLWQRGGLRLGAGAAWRLGPGARCAPWRPRTENGNARVPNRCATIPHLGVTSPVRRQIGCFGVTGHSRSP